MRVWDRPDDDDYLARMDELIARAEADEDDTVHGFDDLKRLGLGTGEVHGA